MFFLVFFMILMSKIKKILKNYLMYFQAKDIIHHNTKNL